MTTDKRGKIMSMSKRMSVSGLSKNTLDHLDKFIFDANNAKSSDIKKLEFAFENIVNRYINLNRTFVNTNNNLNKIKSQQISSLNKIEELRIEVSELKYKIINTQQKHIDYVTGNKKRKYEEIDEIEETDNEEEEKETEVSKFLASLVKK